MTSRDQLTQLHLDDAALERISRREALGDAGGDTALRLLEALARDVDRPRVLTHPGSGGWHEQRRRPPRWRRSAGGVVALATLVIGSGGVAAALTGSPLDAVPAIRDVVAAVVGAPSDVAGARPAGEADGGAGGVRVDTVGSSGAVLRGPGDVAVPAPEETHGSPNTGVGAVDGAKAHGSDAGRKTAGVVPDQQPPPSTEPGTPAAERSTGQPDRAQPGADAAPQPGQDHGPAPRPTTAPPPEPPADGQGDVADAPLPPG